MPIAKHTLALAKDCDAFYYIYLIVHNRTRLELTNTVCWCHTDAPAGTAPAIEMDIRLNFLLVFGPSTFVAMTQCRQTYAFDFMKTEEHTRVLSGRQKEKLRIFAGVDDVLVKRHNSIFFPSFLRLFARCVWIQVVVIRHDDGTGHHRKSYAGKVIQ